MDHLWAKTRQAVINGKSILVDYLPLSHHSCDVAANLWALLETKRFSGRAARILGRPLTQTDIARLACFAALHDIGKGNAGFQSKIFPPKERHRSELRGHTREATYFLSDQGARRKFVEKNRLREMASWFFNSNDLVSFLLASWSHHGVPIAFNPNSRKAPDLDESQLTQTWAPWRWATVDRTLDTFSQLIEAYFQPAFVATEPFPHSPEFQAFFAGLLCLADWLGSSQDYFDFHGHNAEDRFAWSRRRATALLQQMGVDSASSSAAIQAIPFDFQDIFKRPAPNALQCVIIDLPPVSASQGSVTIIESETGSGKTEAAIARALKLWQQGAIDSIYFGLPTRTSGVQIHKRLSAAIKAAFDEQAPPVVLAIPGYMPMEERSTTILEDPKVRWDDEFPSGIPPREWFTENSKRYLAAPIAAGTIDQLLFSVLRTKHAHMRAACLAGSLLIIDEVHASDVYMTRLTVELVERHVAAGGHVLLMSATLGTEAAQKYLGGTKPNRQQAVALAYPLVRYREGKAGGVKTFPVTRGEDPPQKRVTMRVADLLGQNKKIAEIAAEHASQGAKVLVIRNTVRDCVETRRAVSALLPPERLFWAGHNVAAPHHGRFAPEDRRLLDAAVEVHFGQDRRDGGMALVATQTVEQSLDIDADILITDLAPMDVLLQRLGRLHRHQRDGSPGGLPARPEAYRHPTCIVVAPSKPIDLIKRAAHGIGEDRAYQDVRVIELTLRQIRQRPEFIIPAMNRDLVEATIHSESLAALDREDQIWSSHGSKIMGIRFGDSDLARNSLLCISEPFGVMEQYIGFDENEASSRLGAGTVSAMFSPEARPLSPFNGMPLAVLNIPHWMAPQSIKDGNDAEHPVLLSQTERLFTFRFGEKLYAYGEDGLEQVKESKNGV